MKLTVKALTLLCLSTFVLGACHDAEKDASSGGGAAPTASMTPREAVDLLKERGILNADAPKLKEKSAEFEEHVARYCSGQESINDYPYIDAMLELYRIAMSVDWAKLPTRAVRAFAKAGCSMRNMAVCCSCAVASEAPDEDLLLCVLEIGAQQGAEALKSVDSVGRTPLIIAALQGAPTEYVERMISAGADVNAADQGGFTPLMYAAALPVQHQHAEEIVSCLIKAGAHIDAKSAREWTPLMLAAGAGQLGAVKLLLAHQESLNARNDRGASALLLAAEARRYEVCRLLTEAGADVNLKDYGGDTALTLLVRETPMENEAEARPVVAKMLEAGADADAANFNGWNSLMLASRNGTAGLIQDLLKAGAAVDAKDFAGMTSLFFAAGNAREEACKLLLAAGADADMRDDNGMTPLMFATAANSVSICKLLIEAGADVNAESGNGMTAKKLARTPELQELLGK